MSNSNDDKFIKMQKVFLGIAEVAADSMRMVAKTNARNKNLTAEVRDKYAEMACSLEETTNVMHNYKENIGQSHTQEDDDAFFNNSSNQFEFSTNDVDDIFDKTPKYYYDAEKADKQKRSSLMSDELYIYNNIIQWDTKWRALGKLKTLKCENSLSTEVGILRLIFNKETVYLSRAIELNNGGLAKKVHELQALKLSKKLKTYVEIEKNMDDIYIEVICVGNNIKAVEISRKLEKELLVKYKPLWM